MKRFKILMISCFIVCFILLSIRPIIWGMDIKFVWGMDPAEELAGFILYQRAANETYNYDTPVALIEDPNAREYVLPDVELDQGKNYYWIMRAYDIYSVKTGNSNEVRYKLLPNAHEFRIESVIY